MEFLIANILITLVNIGILSLVLKLYTEYYKDKSFSNRKTGRIPSDNGYRPKPKLPPRKNNGRTY